jgi:hypothetical protein
MEKTGGSYYSRYASYTHPAIIGAQDFNNPDLETSDMMQRQIETLNSSYFYTDYNDAEVELTKTNDPIIRVWEFETIVDLNDLDEIAANPYYRVPMTSEHFTGTIYGYILDFKYSNKANYNGGSMATFKIIST